MYRIYRKKPNFFLDKSSFSPIPNATLFFFSWSQYFSDVTEREFWNDAYESDPAHTIVPDHVVLRETNHLSAGTALDMGCGSGQNILALAARGWQVTGIDFSEHAVFLAERAAWKAGVHARFKVADAIDWTSTNRYDLVVSTYSLPVGGRAVAYIRNACKAVAPGGTILIAEWNTSMAPVWGFRECTLHTPDGIAAAMPGFTIIEREVRRIETFFHPADPRAAHGPWAEIAVVRARLE